MVEETAIGILDSHRIMAIATVRPDGWPQTTMVGYANVGLILYFLIFRSSQKFANIENDDRVSVAVGEEPRTLGELQALFAAGHASEIAEPAERDDAWRLLAERHPNLVGLDPPSLADTAMMRLPCTFVSILDYRLGLGRAVDFTVPTNASRDGEQLDRG